jgi:acetoacetyl-[acyl-carrier protein] synthase
VIGEKATRTGGMVQAHGTGTPQNRITESKIISETASAFGIEKWPVAALKSYLGHTLGSASGDQITATLGIWQHGWIPGIHSIDAVAEDVNQDRLQLSSEHQQTDTELLQYSIVNAKGFGGNNATAALLSPTVARKMMQARYSASEWKTWQHANEAVRERQQRYDDDMIAGKQMPIYKFDHGVLGDDDVEMDGHELRIGGQAVRLDLVSPYDDMRID